MCRPLPRTCYAAWAPLSCLPNRTSQPSLYRRGPTQFRLTHSYATFDDATQAGAGQQGEHGAVLRDYMGKAGMCGVAEVRTVVEGQMDHNGTLVNFRVVNMQFASTGIKIITHDKFREDMQFGSIQTGMRTQNKFSELNVQFKNIETQMKTRDKFVDCWWNLNRFQSNKYLCVHGRVECTECA